MMSDGDPVPAPAAIPFTPFEITIYGVSLIDPEGGNPPFAIRPDSRLTLSITPSEEGNPEARFEIVAAYGYSYEGHCYRFDQVRIMVFRTTDAYASRQEINPESNACGFQSPYRTWRVPSAAHVVELNAQAGTFEKLVLDANRPGHQAPSTYRSHMQLAHRGGRLTGGGHGS